MTVRATSLVVLLTLGVAACTDSSSVLRVVSAPPAANQEVAALLERTSRDVETPVRLVEADVVEGAEAALRALEAGAADLAIVENSPTDEHPTIRTVVPLYPSVLHIGVRTQMRDASLRDVLDGATVFAGPDDAPARRLLELLASLYRSRPVELSYVDTLEENPDVVFAFAPVSPRQAPVFDGYVLFSLGNAEDVGSGSLADALALVAPLARPFVIPEGTYGELTPTAIATVAIDTVLVTRRDTPNVAVFDLMQSLQLMAPRLVAGRPDLRVDAFDGFELADLTFPLHPGALAFRARNEPGFAERAASIIEVAGTVFAALSALFIALYRYVRGRRKTRIDELYKRALDIRAKIPSLGDAERREQIVNLRTLRDSAFTLLIDEKLAPDESFRILQELLGDVRRELEAPRGAAAEDA